MTEQERQKARPKLLRALSLVPGLAETLTAPGAVEQKRTRVRQLLFDNLQATFEDDPNMSPLSWVLVRDAIRVFHSLLSIRNEDQIKFSLLRYMDDILHREDVTDLPRASLGFFAEVVHLCRGVAGKAKLYDEPAPAFAHYSGREAARRRSAYLSRMARTAQASIDRYDCGLDRETIRRRSRNKQRILGYFDATDLEWSDWAWHRSNVIRDADSLAALVRLTDEEHRAVQLARKHRIPFGITPYYVSLMDYNAGGDRDRAVRAQVIPSLRYVRALCDRRRDPDASLDFMLERDTSPIAGVTRRYPMIAILKPILTCPQICVYCQRNWQIADVLDEDAVLPKKQLEKAIQWIARTKEIREVLVTGGDPLLLSDERIESLLWKLSRIEHVQRIRIGTRTPVTLPQRITESLAGDISHFHVPGKREILIVTHFEHPYEITPMAMEAVQKLRRNGMGVYNQHVFTFYTSRRFEACAQRMKLRLIGVTPYYTFNTKGKDETGEFRVPIARLLQEQKEETRLLPGAARTDEIVFNIPGQGKNYLRARQHHDLIGIGPDGRRIYEFHPWEKKISAVDTYLYTDVSIHDYLKRLKAIGEDISQYRTIWYYY